MIPVPEIVVLLPGFPLDTDVAPVPPAPIFTVYVPLDIKLKSPGLYWLGFDWGKLDKDGSFVCKPPAPPPPPTLKPPPPPPPTAKYVTSVTP